MSFIRLHEFWLIYTSVLDMVVLMLQLLPDINSESQEWCRQFALCVWAQPMEDDVTPIGWAHIQNIPAVLSFVKVRHMPVSLLSHWGRVMHICISELAIIGSDNGLSPGWRQAITWTNVGILLIGPLGTNFSEILIKILTFSFKKMRLKVSSTKRRPFCLSLNVLRDTWLVWEGNCHATVPMPVTEV